MDHGLWDGTLLRLFDANFSALQNGLAIQPHDEFKDFAFHLWNQDREKHLSFWADLVGRQHNPFPRQSKPISPKISGFVIKSTDRIASSIATTSGVTVSTIFHAAFQIWLADQDETISSTVSFDYLLTGRNVDMSNPQSINGNCANFLPFCARIEPTMTLKQYLVNTQDFFWEATKHGSVGLDDIYAAAGLDRQVKGNRCLFLFQPFEPGQIFPQHEMRYVSLAISEVRMFQPYALVVEWGKMPAGKGYKVKDMYDENFFAKAEAEKIADEQIVYVTKVMEASPDCFLGEIFGE